MTRGLRRPRPFWLLALVLVLSVLTVPDAPPAAADHGETTVWSATLTAGPLIVGVGCENGFAGVECSSTSVLTDDDFRFAGADYAVTGLGTISGATLDLSFDKEIPAAMRSGGTLYVDGSALRLADAGLSENKRTATWSSTGLSWSAGDKVRLSLTRGVRAGDLDHTFGIGGKVTTAFNSVHSEIFDMVEQPDGKVVAVGWVTNVNRHGNQEVTSKDFAVVRYNPDGSLDTGFGDEGRVLTNFTVPGSHNGGDDEARAVALQSDGKIVVAGYAANPNLGQEFVVARYNVDGSLDTGFGPEYSGSKRGFAVHNFVSSAQNDVANAVAVQTVGGAERILVGGQAGSSFGLVRYNSSGALDAGFGNILTQSTRSGFTTVNFSSTLEDGAQAMAVDASNKIVLAGFATNDNNTASNTNDDHKDFALLRLTTAGDPDGTFGTNGTVRTNISGTSGDEINDIAIDSNGKIVAAGLSIGNIGQGVSGPRLTLARYNTNGALDTGFSSDGHVTTLVSGTARANAANAVAVQSDGKIVAAGYGGSGFAVYRYTSAGALDTAFSSDGRASVTIGDDGNETARAIALVDGGGILVGGEAARGRTVSDFALARFTSAGALDEDGDFGAGGIVITSFSSVETETTAMAVQSDGKIVVAGTVERSTKFALARYRPSGLLDNDFGSAGRVTTDFGAGKDVARAVAIDSNGKIVVAGYTNNGTNDDIAVARYTSAGALDTGFSTDGKATVFFGSSNDFDEQAYAVAVQSDDKIVVAGYMTSDNNTPDVLTDDHLDFALVRLNTDGTLDTGFGTGGRVSTAISSANDQINAMVIDSAGKIVVAANGFALARYNANGTLDTGFGTSGTVTASIGSNAAAYALAIDSAGKIVAAGAANEDFALARYNANGTLDTGFGTSGTVTTDISTADDEGDTAFAVAIQSDGKILAAGNARDFIDFSGPLALVRYNADGTLDTGFGTAGTGKVTTDLVASQADSAVAIALRPAGKILVAAATLDLYFNESVFGLVRYVEQTPVSTEATLSALSVSTSTDGSTFGGTATLSPAFASGTLIYSTTQRSTVSHVKVTPTVSDSNASVTVQGTATASGTASASIALTEGTATLVTVVVTAEDGTTTSTYTITVEVDSGDATLSALSVSSSTDGSAFGGTVPLVPAFKPATTSYSASAEPDVTHVKVTPTVSDSNASVTVQGTATASGSASAAIAVSMGTTTTVSVVVTAQDNQVSKTYTVGVNVGQVATLAVAPNPVGEGSSAQITVTITEAKATAISIPLVVTAGSAESGDYSAPSSVPIAAGATSGTAALRALQDSDADDETLTVALGASLPADLNAGSPNSVTVTIDDDEVRSTVSITGMRGIPLLDEGVVGEGETLYVFVGVSPAQPNRITIPLEYANVDSESSDYSGPSSVTVGAGNSYGFAQIRILHDSDAQDEHFTVSLGSNLPLLTTAGAPSSWTVTIDDDEFFSEVSIARVQPDPVLEGETVYVVLRMDPPQPVSVTIPVTLTPGSAESGDYASLTSVTFDAGQPEGVATLRTNHDSDTDDETLTVSVGATLPDLITAGAPGSATFTIEDDDATVTPRQTPGVFDPEPGNGSLLVTWFIRDDHSPYASFDVDYRAKGTASWSTASAGAALNEGRGSHTISGLANGTTYEVRVRARNAAGTGPWSYRIEEGTPVAPPAAPTISSVEPPTRYGSGTKLAVTWNAPSTAVTAYHLRWREQGTSAWQRRGSLDGDNWLANYRTGGQISGLSPGTTYQVQVRALIGNSTGPWSATTTGTTATGTTSAN